MTNLNLDYIADLIDKQHLYLETRITPKPLKFFKPKENFWDILKNYLNHVKSFADCGCGAGHITDEANDRGIRMRGFDIWNFSPHNPYITNQPAHWIKAFSKTYWPLVCRPNHALWVHHLYETTKKYGCGFIYVGHEWNVLDDVTEDTPDTIFKDRIGHEGEFMFIWESEPNET